MCFKGSLMFTITNCISSTGVKCLRWELRSWLASAEVVIMISGFSCCCVLVLNDELKYQDIRSSKAKDK